MMISLCTSAGSKLRSCSSSSNKTHCKHIREAIEICDSYKFKTPREYNPYYYLLK